MNKGLQQWGPFYVENFINKNELVRMKMSKSPQSLVKGDGNFRGRITYAEAAKLMKNSTLENQVHLEYLRLLHEHHVKID